MLMVLQSFTFDGPGFEDTIQSNKEDPDLYLYRGFTYVFDNTTNGGNHPSVSKTLKDYKAHHILMDSLEVAVAYYISLCRSMHHQLFTINAQFMH